MTSKMDKIIDYILDCDYRVQRGEIEYLLYKAYKSKDDMIKDYSEEIEDSE